LNHDDLAASPSVLEVVDAVSFLEALVVSVLASPSAVELLSSLEEAVVVSAALAVLSSEALVVSAAAALVSVFVVVSAAVVLAGAGVVVVVGAIEVSVELLICVEI